MYDLPAFLAVIADADWFHQSETIACSVTGQIVYMNRMKAIWTMIAVASVANWQHLRATIGADKTCIFCFSTHTEPPDI